LLDSIADALDAEIVRWEQLAADDLEARSVLRAFLGLRELLWEFGVRRSGSTDAGEKTVRSRKARSTRTRQRKTVRRVPVEDESGDLG
jgi:hypothetical protein